MTAFSGKFYLLFCLYIFCGISKRVIALGLCEFEDHTKAMALRYSMNRETTRETTVPTDTSADWSGCDTVCEGLASCSCPGGFLMDGVCIQADQCPCYKNREGLVTDGGSFWNKNCTKRCKCRNFELACENYSCHSEGICVRMENTSQCECKDGFFGDGEMNCEPLRDCFDVYKEKNSTANGEYRILPSGLPGLPFKAYCNMDNGGGWTVFQRRVNGSVQFHLDWASYKTGFGDTNHEHWLGNDVLYLLTNQRDYQFRIDMIDQYMDSYFASYTLFRISNETYNYTMTHLGNFSGTAGYDGMRECFGQAFSTYDRDNDESVENSCAVSRTGGGWWFKACYFANLNAEYGLQANYGIAWRELGPVDGKIIYTEMKLRPVLNGTYIG